MNGTDILTQAQKLKDDIIRIRRTIHMNPELGLEEYQTSQLIENTLKALGITTQRAAGTGVVGLLTGKNSGKTVAIRADIDALPLSDEKEVDYSSKVPGKMHACGHDVHTAALLGAAMLLSQYKNYINGNVKFIFQPAEETVGGALPMINEGVLENPQVDAVFGLHCNVDIDAGQIGVMYGKSYAASDMFDIEIIGKGSHGAAPHKGIDAIAIGAQVVSVLQNVVSRNVDPTDAAVITVGVFQGGYQRNIIADSVKLSGIVRTLDPITRDATIERLKHIVYSVCTAMGATVKIRVIPSYPSLINDSQMVNLVKAAAEELMEEKNIIQRKIPTMGVEDFAYFLQQVPGAFYQLGVRNKEKGIVHPLHSSLFDIDENVLPLAAALHTAVALRFLANEC